MLGFEFLDNIGLTSKEKASLIREFKFDPQSLKYGVDYAIRPGFKPIKSLGGYIRWAARNKPEISKDPIHEIRENYEYSRNIERNFYSVYYILESFNKYVEIRPITYGETFCLEYAEESFKEKLLSEITKKCFIKNVILP